MCRKRQVSLPINLIEPVIWGPNRRPSLENPPRELIPMMEFRVEPRDGEDVQGEEEFSLTNAPAVTIRDKEEANLQNIPCQEFDLIALDSDEEPQHEDIQGEEDRQAEEDRQGEVLGQNPFVGVGPRFAERAYLLPDTPPPRRNTTPLVQDEGELYEDAVFSSANRGVGPPAVPARPLRARRLPARLEDYVMYGTKKNKELN
jgi:hypothetical protein